MALKAFKKLAAVMVGTLALLSLVNPSLASLAKDPICTSEDTRQAVVDCFEYFKACESRNVTVDDHTHMGDCGNTHHAWTRDSRWPLMFQETFPVKSAVHDTSNQHPLAWDNLRYDSGLMKIAISGDEEYGNLLLVVEELVSSGYYYMDSCCMDDYFVDHSAVTYSSNLTNAKNSMYYGRDEL